MLTVSACRLESLGLIEALKYIIQPDNGIELYRVNGDGDSSIETHIRNCVWTDEDIPKYEIDPKHIGEKVVQNDFEKIECYRLVKILF